MTDIWKTQDGREIPVEKMTDKHLRNTYRMMIRKGFTSLDKQLFYLICTEPRGEMAQYAFEQECDRLFSKRGDKWIDIFEDEALRRGIAID